MLEIELPEHPGWNPTFSPIFGYAAGSARVCCVALVEALLPSQAIGDAGFRFDLMESCSEASPRCATVNPFC